CVAPVRTATIDERTGPLAWKVHWRQPVPARRAWITPPALPTNTWPSITVGCANAVTSPSKPNAHFSVSRRTCSMLKRAVSADWNREFVEVGLHPFHAAFGGSTNLTLRSVQNAEGGGADVEPATPR